MKSFWVVLFRVRHWAPYTWKSGTWGFSEDCCQSFADNSRYIYMYIEIKILAWKKWGNLLPHTGQPLPLDFWKYVLFRSINRLYISTEQFQERFSIP